MTYGWMEMVGEFRSLGGRADNLFPRNGSRGRGIFALDKAKPVRLRVPENLLVPVEDVEFVDDRLKVTESSKIGVRERDFFERYQNSFSWGGGGRADCASFVEGMKSLGLDAGAAFNALQGEPPTRERELVEQRFLDSRCIAWKGQYVIAPLLDLVNHEQSAAGYKITDGIAVGGIFADEVLVHYDAQDPFGMFMCYGFASPERLAFSLPLKSEGSRQLVIGRDINFGAKRGEIAVPEFTIEHDRVVLSCLLLGYIKYPRIPKSTFLSIMREAKWDNPEEEFERIMHQNRMKFFRLLEVLETEQGYFAATAKKAIRYQLQAMSHCYGTREL